jgi:hypothetical protein
MPSLGAAVFASPRVGTGLEIRIRIPIAEIAQPSVLKTDGSLSLVRETDLKPDIMSEVYFSRRAGENRIGLSSEPRYDTAPATATHTNQSGAFLVLQITVTKT